MAQLIVRNLEDLVVRRLREKAAAEGISVEEAHRRLLRSTLLGSAEPAGDLKSHLLAIPKAGDDETEELFERRRDLPREAAL